MINVSRRARAVASFVSVLFGCALASCASTPGRERALDPVMATAFSADERTMAVSTATSEVALFDLTPLRFRVLLTPDRGKTLSWKEAQTLPGVTGLFRSPPVAFSPNGDVLVAAGAGGEVVGWDVGSGSVRFRAPAEPGMVDLAFFPDGRSFVTVGPTVRRWSAENASALGELKPPGDATVTSVGVSRDGRVVLAGLSNGEIAEFDALTGQVLRILTGHSASVTGIAFSPGGSEFASTAGRFDPRIWKTTENVPLPRKLSEVGGIDESLDKAGLEAQGLMLFAWILGTAGSFRIVGAPMGVSPMQSVTLESAARQSAPYCGPRVAYSPDGRFLAATAQLPLIAGEFQVVLAEMARKEGRILYGIYGCSVAFTRDSKFLVTGGMGAPQIWNAETGERVDDGKGHN